MNFLRATRPEAVIMQELRKIFAEEVIKNPTEAAVNELEKSADVVVDTHACTPNDVLVRNRNAPRALLSENMQGSSMSSWEDNTEAKEEVTSSHHTCPENIQF